jgi:hypothetical protein
MARAPRGLSVSLAGSVTSHTSAPQLREWMSIGTTRFFEMNPEAAGHRHREQHRADRARVMSAPHILEARTTVT